MSFVSFEAIVAVESNRGAKKDKMRKKSISALFVVLCLRPRAAW